MRIVNPSFALDEGDESRSAGAKAGKADWRTDLVLNSQFWRPWSVDVELLPRDQARGIYGVGS